MNRGQIAEDIRRAKEQKKMTLQKIAYRFKVDICTVNRIFASVA